MVLPTATNTLAPIDAVDYAIIGRIIKAAYLMLRPECAKTWCFDMKVCETR